LIHKISYDAGRNVTKCQEQAIRAGGCDIDLLDFSVLAQNWLQDNPAIDIVPYPEADGIIDLKELLVLVKHWLEGTGE